MPPSMLSREALVIWIFRIAMKAPIIAATRDIHTTGVARSGSRGAAREAGVKAERARADTASPLGSNVSHLGFFGRVRGDGSVRIRPYGRDHRHAWAQHNRCIAIERDLDGDALNHLGEIAGGIVWRQQRKLLTACWREAVDMSVYDLAREHVDGNIDRLTRMHVSELGFLVVGDNVDAGRRHQ